MQKTKKKWIMMVIAIISAAFLRPMDVSAQTTKSMYGGKLNINAVAGSENTLGVYLSGELGIGILSQSTTTDNKPIWFLGGYVGPSIRFDGSIRLNLAAGYEQNMTYERGQYAGLLGISGEIFSLEATKLWPSNATRSKYPGNFVISGSWYPSGSTVGIGGFYQKEYQCAYIGIKISIRIGTAGTGSSSRSTGFNCCGYGKKQRDSCCETI